MTYLPSRIFVDKSLSDEPWVYKILGNLPDIPVNWGDAREFQADILRQIKISPPKESALLLQRQYGQFIRPCPGTKNYLCCGYQIIDFAAGCNLGCHYCILQAYLNFPYPIIYANLGDLFSQLDTLLSRHKGVIRLGTGEFTDSLLWDDIIQLSGKLIPFIGNRKNAVLELKTKTVQIGHLKKLAHNNRVIIAWSLNSKVCIEHYENNTASLKERLEAAANVARWGYRLAFHFDPIIYYPGWENDYAETINLLFEYINPEDIAWISLGAFRFMPKLKQLIAEKYPKDRFIYEEFIPGLDKKMRYFKPIRIKMYKSLYDCIRKFAPKTCVYLCMESTEVWHEVFGYTPVKYGGLGNMLLDGFYGK